MNEIKKALNDLNKDSSPGCDGLSMCFYTTFIDEIKEILFEFYRECLAIGNLGDNASLGLISLIHKGKSLIRNNVLNWRPITLSNID